MFGPTASPVVQAQSTWHIGPTTCVFTSRRTARFESVGSSCARNHSRAADRRAVVLPRPRHSRYVRRMAATMMDGRALAERIRAEVAEEVRALGGVGLATVLVGDDAASDIYIRRKHEAAEQAGFSAHDLRLPATISESELLDRVAGLNADDTVDALLVQLPLPDGIDEERVIRAVDPAKDVDGFHPL